MTYPYLHIFIDGFGICPLRRTIFLLSSIVPAGGIVNTYANAIDQQKDEYGFECIVAPMKREGVIDGIA